jgi:uncharacterized HAD superfamily protein
LKYKIALDLDGVLAELLEGFCSIYNERHKRNLSLDQINDWYFFDQLGFSEEELLDFLDEVWSMWWIIPPTESNLKQYLLNLTESRPIIIDIVTCRNEKTTPYVKKWLKKHKIPYRSLVIAKDVAEKLSFGYDIYIDDSPHLMKLIATNNVKAKAILYVRPWNSTFSQSKNVFRAENWEQIYQILKDNTRI